MDIVLYVLIFVFFVAMIPLGLAQRARRQAALVQLAEQLGMELSVGGTFGYPVIAGAIDRVLVRVEYVHRGSGKSKVPWTRVVGSGCVYGTTLEAEGLKTGLIKVFTGEDHVTGDPAFDERVAVRGAGAVLLPLLDEETRRAVARVLTLDDAHIGDGEVVIERKTHVMDAGTLRALLSQAADLARRLAEPNPEATAQKLARNVRTDGAALVRLRSLLALDADHSGPLAAAVAGDALADDDPRVRLLAARILGDTDRLRDASLDALFGLAPHDPARLARAYVKLGDTFRLQELLSVEVDAVRIAALHGLARIGTPEAVEALLPLTKGIFRDEGVRSAARAAVESIQARVGADAAGRVALAEHEAGEVSLAPDAGRVSLPEPDDRPAGVK